VKVTQDAPDHVGRPNQRRETLQQFHRIEDEVRRPIRPPPPSLDHARDGLSTVEGRNSSTACPLGMSCSRSWASGGRSA
jgi:hypothetical protein